MQTPTSTPEEFGQVWQTALYQRLCFKSNLLIHVGVQKASSSSPGLSCTIGMSLLRASASSPMIAFRSTPGSNQMPPVSTAASLRGYAEVQQNCLQQQTAPDTPKVATDRGNSACSNHCYSKRLIQPSPIIGSLPAAVHRPHHHQLGQHTHSPAEEIATIAGRAAL
jgi:hypothetical protein